MLALPRRLFASAAISVLLAGCGIVPFSTQMKLRNFDPLAVDPNEPRALIVMPEVMRIPPDGAKIRIIHWPQEKEGMPEEDILTLQETDEPVPVGLRALALEGERLSHFRLKSDELARIRAIQAKFAQRKASGSTGGKTEIKADVTACALAALPAGRITGTLYVKPDRATGYLPLIEAMDLRDLAASAGKTLEAEVKPCPLARKSG